MTIPVAASPSPLAGPPGGSAPVSPPPTAWSPADAPAGIPWERHLAALRRHRKVVVGAILLSLLAGVLATRVFRPKYEVHSSIWVATPTERQQPSYTNPSNVGHPDAVLQTHALGEVLRSYSVLDPVVGRLALFVTPAKAKDSAAIARFGAAPTLVPGKYTLEVDDAGRHYALKDKNGSVVERGTVGDSVGRRLGFRWAPTAAVLGAGRSMGFTVVLPRQAAMRLRDRLDIWIPDSSFIVPRLTGTEPQRDAAILNEIDREFVATATDLTRRTRGQVAQLLGEQLAQAESTLRGSETVFGRYRTGTVGLPAQDDASAAQRDPTLGVYFDQKTQYDNVRHDREALERVLRSRAADGGVDAAALMAIPSVREAPELAGAIDQLTKSEGQLEQMRRSYTDEYRPVQDLKSDITRTRRQTLPALGAQVLERLRSRERNLASRLAGSSGELRGAPTRAIQQQRLERNVQVNAGTYTALRAQYDAARLAEMAAVPGVAILDSAVAPLKPVTNTIPGILAASLLGGLALGVACALLLEAADRRLWYPEQVQELGLETLGGIPVVRGGSGDAADPVAAAQVIEAFRSLRLNIRNALRGESPLTLAVLSIEMGDGKSFVATQLARSFAQSGYRTVLIDGDVRRGGLATAFHISRSPGLTEYLSGTASPRDIVRTTPLASLSVVPSGARIQEGPELLSSRAVPELLAALGADYDVIIVDTPPVGAGADAASLGAATRNAILVLRAGKTDRKGAKARLALFEKLPVRRLGAVLNAIRAEGAFQYYSYLPEYAVYTGDGDPRPDVVTRTAATDVERPVSVARDRPTPMTAEETVVGGTGDGSTAAPSAVRRRY